MSPFLIASMEERHDGNRGPKLNHALGAEGRASLRLDAAMLPHPAKRRASRRGQAHTRYRCPADSRPAKSRARRPTTGESSRTRARSA